MKNKKPVLSIGMIFRDNIRSLERCLKALQPLRAAIPCELVMADTGAIDGSREVAEKYADILFDFEWINDFSAARNAVMDRCSGEWYLTIDSDEYLDENISELKWFFSDKTQWSHSACIVIQRNYKNYEMTGEYNDFLAVRMIRLSPEVRYHGAIHESLPIQQGECVLGFRNIVLHHDGYVDMGDPVKGKAKRERNLKLLKEKLENDPENLCTLVQCVESSGSYIEKQRYVQRGIDAIEKHENYDSPFSAIVYRYAVHVAQMLALPEFFDLEQKAWEKFPNSLYTRLDVAYFGFVYRYQQGEDGSREEMIRLGEEYLKQIKAYRAGQYDPTELLYSILSAVSVARESVIRILLSDLYCKQENGSRAREVLDGVVLDDLSEEDIRNYLSILLNLHSKMGEDVSGFLCAFWDMLEEPDNAQRHMEKKKIFFSFAAQAFHREHREEERNHRNPRHAYTAFLPLADRSELGIGAAVLESQDAEEIAQLLLNISDWKLFPTSALAHAISLGVELPMEQQAFAMEELDWMALGIMKEKRELLEIIMERSLPDTVERLNWSRALALAAVHTQKWENAENGVKLARFFARIESELFKVCYAPITQDTVWLLPALHRFGWYLIQAFEALDQGDSVGYIRLLKQGLTVCEPMKVVAEFLLEQFEEQQTAVMEANEEMAELAKQVKSLLSQFPEDHSAVLELKQSELYKEVAFLIEDRKEVVPS